MATPTYELIETQTLASSASSVTFDNIPQDYRDLVLISTSKSSGSARQLNVRFENDSGTNYTMVYAAGLSSSTSSSSYSSNRLILTNEFNVSLTENSLVVLQIMDYSVSDKHKSVLIRANDGSQAVEMIAARWADTSVIERVEYLVTSNQIAAGSTFSLYGIAA